MKLILQKLSENESIYESIHLTKRFFTLEYFKNDIMEYFLIMFLELVSCWRRAPGK